MHRRNVKALRLIGTFLVVVFIFSSPSDGAIRPPSVGPRVEPIHVAFSIEYNPLLRLWSGSGIKKAEAQLAQGLAVDLSAKVVPWTFVEGTGEPRVVFSVRPADGAEVRIYAELIIQGRRHRLGSAALWDSIAMASDAYSDYTAGLGRLHNDVAELFFEDGTRLRELTMRIRSTIPLGYGGDWAEDATGKRAIRRLTLSLPQEIPYMALGRSKFRVECQSPHRSSTVHSIGTGKWTPLGAVDGRRLGLTTRPQSYFADGVPLDLESVAFEILREEAPGEYFLEVLENAGGPLEF